MTPALAIIIGVLSMAASIFLFALARAAGKADRDLSRRAHQDYLLRNVGRKEAE